MYVYVYTVGTYIKITYLQFLPKKNQTRFPKRQSVKKLPSAKSVIFDRGILNH